MTELNREQESVLLIAYKYFYRKVDVSEAIKEIAKDGLLDMTHNEFVSYRAKLILERKAMLHYFNRPNDWQGEQLSLY